MGSNRGSKELEAVGELLKKLLLTPYPACLNDDHKQELKKALELRQKLYKKKLEEKHGLKAIN